MIVLREAILAERLCEAEDQTSPSGYGSSSASGNPTPPSYLVASGDIARDPSQERVSKAWPSGADCQSVHVAIVCAGGTGTMRLGPG